MSLEFFNNQPCDTRQYLRLMKTAYGKIFDENWFRWYNNSAPTGRSRIYFCVDSETGQMVSSLAFLPIRVTCRGTPQPGSIYVNAMTAPAYQGRGLNLKLLQSALLDARKLGEKISITFPADSRMSIKGMLKTGWEPVCDIHYSALDRTPSKTHSSAQRIASLDNRFDPLLEAFYARLKFGHFKDHEFFNWRVCDRPDQEYEIYAKFDGGIPAGIIVLKFYEEKSIRKTHIIELIGIDDGVIIELLRLAEREAHFRKSDILNTWLFDDSVYRDQLTEFGFAATADKNTLMVHWHEGATRQVSDRLHMHFSLADNDVY